MVLMLVVMFVAFYFFGIRPQKKQEKEALQVLFEGKEIKLTAEQRALVLSWAQEAADGE